MQQLAADPKFAAAATGYVEDMAKDVLEAQSEVGGIGAELDEEDDDEEEDEEEDELDEEEDEEEEEDDEEA